MSYQVRVLALVLDFPEAKSLFEREVGPTVRELRVGEIAEGSQVVRSFCGHGL